MAVTKIWAIKKTLGKAIKYILNPEKTQYVSSYACAPETADLEFELTLDENSRSGGVNKAYHMIQSFKPEEITPILAHEIGKQLLEQHLQGKYEYVLTTHVDKDHIHNHVIFCASSFVTHTKYNDCDKTYYQLRETSDTLCAEHGLSVIPPNQNKGKSYHEWQKDQQGDSWKTQLKEMIDTCIQTSKDFETFTASMQAQGYELKYGKHLAFRAEKQKRFTRGKTLGEAYTEENIKARIADSCTLPVKKNKKINLTNQPLSVMLALDKNKKVLESKGYEQWAKIHNLKHGAKTLNLLQAYGIHSLAEWEEKKISHQEVMNTCTSEIKTIEKELAHVQAILKQLTIYADTKTSMSKTPKNKRKTPEYESATLLNKTAKKALQEDHITPSKQIKTELQHQVQILQKKQQQLYKEHKALKQTQKQYHIIEQNLMQLLKPTIKKSFDREQ
ncbi:relaxase/mobilization nuclease domain-containing protein [Listeria sp. FSL L7-1582]|uniref:relaxase/mobilization nuclease domain-containing protein n=1 Tax=Listeria portnoyi TaxID=2713504 RepID=UPI00164DCED1|nr:relaxase/mobilization nuclease domain-containing protein [Listeria portnoyi]MBC6308762.1 relaxase/mobilization nuclease domain-containing protein [Listeria portnoyi]